MPRYIDVDKAYDLARTDIHYSDFGRSMADLTSLRELLDDTPTADVVPVVHAHWIRTNSGKWRCSRCRGRHDRPKRYCGECGARMNEQKEGDNGD